MTAPYTLPADMTIAHAALADALRLYGLGALMQPSH